MRPLLIAAFLTTAAPVAAHPHVFIDVGFRVIADEAGRLRQIEVTWAYDALTSLMITEDRGLDADGDMALTPKEESDLAGWDMQWVEGFNGDLVGAIDGADLAFGPPQDATATMREGRIVSTHRRTVAGAPDLSGAVLSLKPFDPGYYSAYDVTLGVSVAGRDGCLIEKELPDIDREMERLQTQLAELGRDQDAVEMGFPEVGEAFATEVRISCAGS